MGIWEYQEYFTPSVDKAYQLSSNEGNTITRTSHVLATMLGVPDLHLKREDLNPSGSHKDRALSFQLSAHMQEGARKFAISSSGNAAISAISYSRYLNIELHVFLSTKINETKIQRLQRILEQPIKFTGEPMEIQIDNFVFHFGKRPVSDSVKFTKDNGATLLRGATDPYAIEGYKTIAFEMIKQLPSAKEIFIPVSSGTAAVGIYEGYKQINERMSLEIEIPELHIVQTSKVNTLAREYDKDFESTEDSIVDSITDKVGHRRQQIASVIRESKGSGWVVNDEEVKKAESLLRFANISVAAEGAMSLAAIKKALTKGHKLRNPVCVITGVKS